MSDDSKSRTTAAPRSCGEAWIEYYLKDGMADGTLDSSCVDVAQAAFDAGWQAAMEAMKPIPTEREPFVYKDETDE